MNAGPGAPRAGEAASRGRARGPILFQANIRTWLTALSVELDRRAGLDDLPDAFLDGLARRGFDILYLLGIWGSGPRSGEIARSIPELRHRYLEALPDLREGDICGSCFAVPAYRVPEAIGGDEALTRLRGRLHDRGMRLMVDFVPNHIGVDHPWVSERRDLLLQGRREDFERSPGDYRELETQDEPLYVAHGKDPYFPGWTDTVQLDYSSDELQAAMIEELRRVAHLADGVRCDMAMLVLPEVFERTWGRAIEPFWPRATAAAREECPGFVFLAEAYWGTQERLLQDGFDFCYDKELYDGLLGGNAWAVRDRLALDPALQAGMARFLENHDEDRAARAFGPAHHRAAALICLLAPGLRFIHQGQLEGYRIHVPMQLCRGPQETADEEVVSFYDWLLPLLRHPALSGEFRLLEVRPPWEGGEALESLIAMRWSRPADADGVAASLFVVVNLSADQAACRLSLDLPREGENRVCCLDVSGGREFSLDRSEVVTSGLLVELPPWGYLVFEPSEGGAVEGE